VRLYDTARRAIVPFEPNDLVTMYTCGITPYDATHLGHAATFIVYDVLQRRLIDLGHTVKCVRNVTDVDDPLFAKARQLGIHYLDLAAGEEARFERDMEAMNVAAWPRCVASYGVIPHVYINTWSLGSNATMACRAVSYSCMVAELIRRGKQPGGRV